MSDSVAYTFLKLSSIDAEARVITGIASTPTPDRDGDVINPKGLRFKSPLPLLLHHDTRMPVGTVVFKSPRESGIEFVAHIPKVTEPGIVKDRTDEAFHSAKYGLITGASIRFLARRDKVRQNKSGGLDIDEAEVVEMSMVTIPCNPDAGISGVKSLFHPVDPASGIETVPKQLHTPGVTGTVVRLANKDASTMKPIAERKTAFVAEKAAKVAKLNEIAGEDDGQTMSAEQQTQFDTLTDEIKSLDSQLARLETLEQVNKANAVTVNGDSTKSASESRGSSVVSVSAPKLPPGIGFARAVKSRLVARLDGRNAIEVAKEMYPSDDRLHAHLNHDVTVRNVLMQMKAAVPAATTTLSAWAGALVDPTNLAGEFVEFLRPETIIGRLNLRAVPTNVRLIEQTQGGTGYWVGQGAPKPLTSFGYAPITLSPTKVASIAVATEESLRFSTPSLDMLIRDGLRGALVERVDRDLLDPAEAGSSNVQPASLTHGLVALSSAGTSADNIRTDIAKLIRALRSANLRGRIAIVLPDSLLTAMAWMTNSLGQPEFPGVTGEGGTFNGIRFIGSEYVANSSGAGNMVIAIAENEVFISDDGGVTVDASREATLQMLDNPTNNSATATATTGVSMWQTNSVAFRAEWFINWQKRRSTAVAYMDDVNWGSVGSPS